MYGIEDVPCTSCQYAYNNPHWCDIPDYCPCDHRDLHVNTRGGLMSKPEKIKAWYEGYAAAVEDLETGDLDIPKNPYLVEDKKEDT